LPLLRLAAEHNTPFVTDAVDFSSGQYQAVFCGEYSLFCDLNDSPAKRRRDYARGIEDARENRPDLFARSPSMKRWPRTRRRAARRKAN